MKNIANLSFSLVVAIDVNRDKLVAAYLEEMNLELSSELGRNSILCALCLNMIDNDLILK